MEPLTANAPALQSSIVTLDVLHSGIIWGWFVTMNFWAKSISTGVVLLAPWIVEREHRLLPGLPELRTRLLVPLIAFAALGVTLLFTVLDLHQPFRFWHIFAYTHTTSVLALGAWTLTLYNFGLLGLAGLAFLKRDVWYDRLFPAVWVLAFFATIYTAGLLGQANARELWQTATELPQMVLAATLSGSAVFLLLGAFDDREQGGLAATLGLSAALSLSIYVAEVVFAPQKSEEAEYIVHTLLSGSLGALFQTGLVLAFVIPMVLSLVGLRTGRAIWLSLASVSGLVGLWMVKHAWLIAPQLLPLS